jgi:hypothetical protein
MSIASKLRAVRAILATGVALRALFWGAAAGLTILMGVALVDQHAALPATTRLVLVGVAAVSMLAITGALVWRDRTVASLSRVALWVEEHDPSLEYALVTAVESGRLELHGQRQLNDWATTARHRSFRAAAVPLLAMVIAFGAMLALPNGVVAREATPRAGDPLARPRTVAAPGSRLTPLVADVVPPAYAAARTITMDEPTDIRAIVGSTITIRGRGDATGIRAASSDTAVAAHANGDRWSIIWRVSAKPVALRLSDGSSQRVLAIEPIADNPPSVTLLAPAHDTVLREPKGRIPLSADVNDDLGLANAAFEFIVSSGEGETFTFKSGTLGAIRPSGKQARFATSLSLDSLALKPGAMIHVRAVARDRNDVSGPGIGASETRVIRIARADEYDSVAVDAAPPADAEKSVLSQRMLIMLTEALQKKRTSIKRESLIAESRSIAADQKKLRRRVGEIVFTRLGGEPSGEEQSGDDSPSRAKTMEEMLARADSATNRSEQALDFEGGESPVVAVNKPLLEAYNAMWDAGTQLELGEPAKALPHMRRALAAIEKARQAERLYLRGKTPVVVVDVGKARLQGKDKGSSSIRRTLSVDDEAARKRADRFINIVELSARDPRSAADSLLVLRIDALADAPVFAAALGDAANALRRGKADDATLALARARRALAAAPAAQDSIARWGIVP